LLAKPNAVKISIITVVLNGIETISKSIDSIALQRGVDIEHIIIDGGSTDGTLEFLSQNVRSFSRLISGPDNGIYDAMNKGIRLASGDVIGLLNADDFYNNPELLSTVMRQFYDPRIDAVYGDLEYFRGGNPDKIVRTYTSKAFHLGQLKRGLMPAHPTLFLRKKVYERYGLFDSSYKIAGDFEFIARIFKDGSLKAKYLPLKMVKMQMGGISTRGFTNTIILLKENMRACRQNGISTNYFWLVSRYPKKLLEYFF
jgi:glycosyltransferase involved in cell wall biosynthesis